MPDGVDRRLDTMQSPPPKPMLDRSSPDAESTQLRARDDTMLRIRERRDRDIRLRRAMTVMGLGKRVEHAPEFAGRRGTRVRAV